MIKNGASGTESLKTENLNLLSGRILSAAYMLETGPRAVEGAECFNLNLCAWCIILLLPFPDVEYSSAGSTFFSLCVRYGVTPYS